MTMRDAYDYVIVGGGSSGCVVAARLSEDTRVSVLLVESGPGDRTPLITMPLGAGKLMGSAGMKRPRKDYLSYYAIAPGGNRPSEMWLKGRTLGGSSSINGMVYMRGRPADYDRWEELGATGWGWETIGRCFTEIEHHQLGAGPWRGGDGPLRVSISRLDRLGRAALAAAVEAGSRAVEDINHPDAAMQGGVGPQPCTIWRGRRVSAARAFLKPARHRRNLDVVPDTDVLGIVFDGLTATGIRTLGRAGERVILARREVVLCAGAIHSPKLLQLAGIGPAALLRGHDVAVLVDAPEVGCNAQEHRTIKVGFDLKYGGRNRALRGMGLPLSLLKYALAGRGVLSTCIWEVGGMVHTRPDLAEPDCQIGINFLTYDRSGIHRTPGMSLSGYVLRPHSRGAIAIASPDPAVPPTITANFLAADYDRTHTVALYRHLRAIAHQPALRPWLGAENAPGAAIRSDEELVDASFAQGMCANHIAGTCRMGSDPAAVLDPDLRVRGVRGLRVADTSIMPTLVSGNTSGPAMAIGWHAAERIRASANGGGPAGH
jgi:choline dehydrogenase